MALFLVSVLLISWSSYRWATYFSGSSAEVFWIFLASVMLQIGGIACLLSLATHLSAAMWLVTQCCVCGVTFWLAGASGRAEIERLDSAMRRWRAGAAVFVSDLSLWGRLALMAICLAIFSSLWIQAATPLAGFDERMYHASRVIYWIQNQSVFPFDTHNIRQTMIPFGSELFFLWPVLLTKTEVAGRFVFCLAYPLAAVGQYFVLRALKLSQTVALMGVLILLSTPLIAASTLGLKPEIWSVVTLLGVSYWAVSICSDQRGRRSPYFLLGLFVVLSINIRSFPLALLPGLLLIVFWAPAKHAPPGRFKAFFAGLGCAALFSGLLVPLVSNTALYQHPLGPKEVRETVASALTPQVIHTHAVRFAFLMMELPSLPVAPEFRAQFSSAANQLIATLGAGIPLAGEGSGPWPGKFVYALPENSTRYSLWGLLWIPTLLAALVLLARNVAGTWPRVQLTPVSAQTLLAAPLLVAVLFGARWMAQSEVPARFLIGPYALILPVGLALFSQHLLARRWARLLAGAAVAYAAFHPLLALAANAEKAMVQPVDPRVVNEPFAEIVGSLVPAGARVLLIAGHDVRDYPLFSPATGYSNTVVPWGGGSFDPLKMRDVIASQKISHIVVQHDQRVGSPWAPMIDTREMVKWLGTQAELKAVPLQTPRMRLFEVRGVAAMNEKPFEVATFPAAAPLIELDSAIKMQVGVDPVLLNTSWPVENLGGDEAGFLWLGQGAQEGIEFGLWSRNEREVDVRFDVSPGFGLSTAGRTVMVQHDGVPVGKGEHSFAGKASIVVRVRLHPGRNIIHFFALDTATIKPLPNGDTRNLVVGLHGIRVAAARPDGTGPDKSPATAAKTAGEMAVEDLASRARKAVGMITRQQQVDGYWRTSYTSKERFENSTFEMNTYVTSMMVDLLGSQPVAVGLAGSLERARAHLRHQIEAGGLVRYHGRPDGSAMAAYGLCPITPDADDTSLAWRLAPAADSTLRTAALATLGQYRTAEGLYKTWLADRRQFRCIDPGADPNPPDIAIQMHVYLWLAQADPPAARALCSALRSTVSQDRIWVYYDKAPLVPVMRQADMKAAGCALELPSSRVQTAVPGQEIWLDASRLLWQLAEGKKSAGGLPPAAQVLQVLLQLSRDDFLLVRNNPPMLYHNDLSASVRRFYWAEDVGYAIWLRLYQESQRAGLLGGQGASGDAAAAIQQQQKAP